MLLVCVSGPCTRRQSSFVVSGFPRRLEMFALRQSGAAGEPFSWLLSLGPQGRYMRPARLDCEDLIWRNLAKMQQRFGKECPLQKLCNRFAIAWTS